MQLNPKTNRQEKQQQSRIPPILQVLFRGYPLGTKHNLDEANFKGQIKPNSILYDGNYFLATSITTWRGLTEKANSIDPDIQPIVAFFVHPGSDLQR